MLELAHEQLQEVVLPEVAGLLRGRRDAQAVGPDGSLRNQWTIAAEAGPGAGLSGLALDRAGVVYAVERNPPSVIRIDPQTGEQRVYATFHDVPGCRPANRVTDCSAAPDDRPAVPYFPVFAPDGTMYVTDPAQAMSPFCYGAGQLPGRKSLADKAPWTAMPNKIFIDQLNFAYPYQYPYREIPQMGSLEVSAVQTAVQNVMLGRATVDQATKDLVTHINAVLQP